jgi:Phosphotransferase enzyme family
VSHEGLETWIRAHVEPTGRIELVHERPWGTVSRVPVAGGVAWFKACAPVQAFEPRLTAALADRWPDRLPVVLAHDEERAWLLLGDAGERLGVGGSPEPWLSILPLYAELQRGEAAQLSEHLAGGVPDRRLAAFPALYEAMFARELPLGSGDVARLRAFASRFEELCVELAAHGVAETIQHDDLHGANVYLRDGTPRILDWGDSCVSHPFMTPFVTFLHLDELTASWVARLRDPYLEPWGRPDELRETFVLAQRIGPFAHVFKELRVLDSIPDEERPRYAPDLAPLLDRCLAVILS